MEYSINLSEGNVYRTSDNAIVSPCQSVEDPDFVAYLDWVYQGNSPTIIGE